MLILLLLFINIYKKKTCLNCSISRIVRTIFMIFNELIINIDHFSIHGNHTRGPGELRIVGFGQLQHSLPDEVDALRIERLLHERLVAAVVATVHVAPNDFVFVKQAYQEFNSEILIRMTEQAQLVYLIRVVAFVIRIFVGY